jgi:hypothetical protein
MVSISTLPTTLPSKLINYMLKKELFGAFPLELLPYAKNNKTWSKKLTILDAIFSSMYIPKSSLAYFLIPGETVDRRNR